MEENKKGKFFIITGISGAGKTQALKIFGDFGFYCVDNLPLALFADFSKYIKTRSDADNIALGIDIREGESIKTLPEIMKSLSRQGFAPKLLFLEANDDVLVRRFSETKHKHPLQEQLLTAIAKERQFLEPIKQIADTEINTGNLTLGELKEKVSKLLEIKRTQEMNVSVVSFGYKHGLPMEADLVMDVRFLKNPYYISALKEKTGLDIEVQDYIKKSPHALNFLKKFTELVLYLIPKYIKEGKSYLTICIGCSGGKHRSVFMAHFMAKILRERGFNVSEFHRDLKIVKKETW